MRHDMKDLDRFVRSFAAKALRRCHAAGAKTVAYEDLCQESWVGWAIACESYNEALDIPFKPFAMRGIRQHVNRYIERYVERRIDEVNALSMDHTSATDDEDCTMHEVIAGAGDSVETQLARESTYQKAITKLTPKARMFLTFLREQPIELIEEVRSVGMRADHARNLGVTSFYQPRHLTASMVFDFMGISRSERQTILTEIKTLGRKVVEAI